MVMEAQCVLELAHATQGQLAFAEAFQNWGRGAGGLVAVLGKIGALLRDKRPAFAPQKTPH